MQSIKSLSQDYVDPNHLKLILNSLETGFIAMREFKEAMLVPQEGNTIYRNLDFQTAVGETAMINEIQKIHVSQINYEDSTVFEDGFLKLDRFIFGIPINEDQIVEEIKKGNIVGYSEEMKSYYMLECKKF